MMQAHPLAELFPMLPDAEIRELADDIVTFGQRVPIVLLDGKILDGRNRHAACQFAKVDPIFVEYDGNDPLNFVLSHNLHRRHLTDSQRAMVAARIVDWETGLNQHSGGAHVPAHKAAERLSISERAVKAARRINEHGAAELVDAIRDGRLSVKTGETLSHLERDAQREVLEREEREIIARAKELRAERQRVRHGERLDNMRRIAGEGAATAPGKVSKKYSVIYADPPWRFGVRSEVTGREKSAENHYPTMDSADIANLLREIGEPATADAVLFLWATNPMLHDALRVMAAWDFDYVHHWIWDKEVAGTGYWGRDRHELLLIGRRGDVAAPLPGSQPETVYRERKGKHSAKPDFFAETIERLYPDVPRIELFCRKPRPGWDAWGFEAASETANDCPQPPVTDQRLSVAGSKDAVGRQSANTLRAERERPGEVVTAGETAPSLPPAPGANAPVEFSIGGMRKHATAQFSVSLNKDGTFAISGAYEFKNLCGGASPRTGRVPSFAEALHLGLEEVARRLTGVAANRSSVCTDQHRAAARAGLRWIEKQAAAWGVEYAAPELEPAS